jgi:hypothetical protein
MDYQAPSSGRQKSCVLLNTNDKSGGGGVGISTDLENKQLIEHASRGKRAGLRNSTHLECNWNTHHSY